MEEFEKEVTVLVGVVSPEDQERSSGGSSRSESCQKF